MGNGNNLHYFDNYLDVGEVYDDLEKNGFNCFNVARQRKRNEKSTTTSVVFFLSLFDKPYGYSN
ncbi:hypothetical protein P4H70_18655 [Paenibacillus ehimensis]|uniref:hypothetical protein n=1 Tax=Paenibacillus ehimensis TaxID=79264 RepID=UPI002DBD2A05|nr:hypothetical protein [Paenibacillus ehimensis]MEC0210964.1 hypothetical protein [Paenibacillus ehimensis]